MAALSRTDKEIAGIYRRHADTVYRVAYSFMKNAPEAEDMTQEAFVRLMQSDAVFASPDHEKAWLIVTVSNLCKSALRHWFRRHEDVDELADTLCAPDDDRTRETLHAVLTLPAQQRAAVYLHYYEGYRTEEVAQLLDKPPATVRSLLYRARNKLKQSLGGDLDGTEQPAPRIRRTDAQ